MESKNRAVFSTLDLTFIKLILCNINFMKPSLCYNTTGSGYSYIYWILSFYLISFCWLKYYVSASFLTAKIKSLFISSELLIDNIWSFKSNCK